MDATTLDPATTSGEGVVPAAQATQEEGHTFLHESLPASLRQIQGTAREGLDYIRAQADFAADRIQVHPLIAVAVAAGTGYLAGRLVTR